jgi:DNA-binding MarR family transcriptional regulator
MRSRNEQQYPPEPTTYREMQLLSEVELNPDVTQRHLSQRIGIALGLTNVLLRNLVQKGYVRVSHASWKRRLYTLTPDGFSHRIRLMAGYVHRFLDHYQRVRQTLREELEPLALNAESRVAIYGTGEFAELVYLGLRERGIEEIDIFDSRGLGNRRFLGMPVLDIGMLQPEHYDRVVIAHLRPTGAQYKQLQEQGASTKQLVTFFSHGRPREGV